jgi:hypothetical protein
MADCYAYSGKIRANTGSRIGDPKVIEDFTDVIGDLRRLGPARDRQPSRTAVYGPVCPVVWELRLVSAWNSVACDGDRGKA